jgi:uncharacterized protein (TIGR02147 family)
VIDVFSYTDYRLLLKDLYEDRKKLQPFFSYRYIGQKVGFSSAGFLTNILQGKRNISPDLVFKFAELYKFNRKETEYFELLVQYDQAKQHSQKRYYYEKMLAVAKSKARVLSADQYEYFDKWYYVAIRELLNFYPFRGDYRELGRRVRPNLTPSEAKKAVDLLLRLNLIRKREDGVYVLTDQTITTAAAAPLVAVHNFQMATMDLAKEAIDRFPRERRSISTLTLSVSKDAFDRINEKLAGFRQEVLELVKNDQNVPDRVYQFNFQIFPMTDLQE